MSELGQIVVAIVPVLVSAFVAFVQWHDKQGFQTQLAALQTRVAVLEQLLRDNNIPLPPP